LSEVSALENNSFIKARRHLARRDAVLKQLIRQVGPCTLTHDGDGFSVLVRAIIAQQISTKAARAISARLKECMGARGVSPAAIGRASDDKLRGAGLSAGKIRALRDLAAHCRRGDLDFKELLELSDEDVIARLLPVHGIGRWTAEMFLIFSLGRLDVLPLADYGLRAGVRKHYALPELPEKDELIERAEPWRPYRSVGTWFIWRSFGNVPQS
jgi:DNA-3-methyladenine glycosylase II